MAFEPVRVGCLGMGWWSDVLADAIARSSALRIVACYTRSDQKREAFAAKYGCRPAPTYEAMLDDPDVEAVINTTPNDAHLETTRAAARAGKHVFLDKPIANTVADARALTDACRAAGVVLALGYQRRRESHFRWIRAQIDGGMFGTLVNAEANISRDRLGQIDLTSWRYTAAGMPGGVMLQIGIHYTDVLEYLMGPITAVSGRLAQLVLPGDNPDVASLMLEHESGALSTLNAQLRVRVRVLSAQCLRQAGDRVLRPPPGPSLSRARDEGLEAGGLPGQRSDRRRSSTSSPPPCADRANPR